MRMLLERAGALDVLDGALSDLSAGGPGRIMSVAGEAGTGKTSLLREFASRAGEVWWGQCDALITPRPLGPLRDIAGAAGADLAEVVRQGSAREELFDAMVAALTARTDPLVVVIEDAHWADEATLDLITFLGRRMAATRALVLVSHRTEESGPLRTVLGRLALGSDRRITLSGLSPASVRAMLGPLAADAARVHAITDGNPFFVTEVVAGLRSGAAADAVPESIADAVIARVAAFAPRAQRCLTACSVHSGPLTPDLVAALAGDDAAGAVDCAERGLLVGPPHALRFRHELARLAVLEGVGRHRRRELHRAALRQLADSGPGEVAWLVEHATLADDHEAVVRYAPLAADRAAAVGANREAAAHLATAVGAAGDLPAAQSAALLERFAAVAAMVGRRDDAIDAYLRAAGVWHTLQDGRREASTLAALVGPLVQAGRQREALDCSERALALLDRIGPSPELVAASERRCTLHMLARELDDAVTWGERTVALARQLGLDHELAVALVQTGVARLMAGDDERGRAQVHDGIGLAERTGDVPAVFLGHYQLGSAAGEIGRFDTAEPALRAAIAWGDHHELAVDYPLAWLARCRLETGGWDEADRLATRVLADPSSGEISRCVAGCVLGRLRARRGAGDMWSALDAALGIARRTGHLQRLWPVAAARAEAAWLYGHLEDELALLVEVAGLADDLRYPLAQDELGWWLWRAGERASPPERGPFRGPYELALVAAESEDASTAQDAYRRLDELGASVVLPRVAQHLRSLGATVPPRPGAAARAHPEGLTPRQAEIAQLLARGRTNREIATELYLSEKTVEHHVSAVLTKLGLASRRDLRR